MEILYNTFNFLHFTFDFYSMCLAIPGQITKIKNSQATVKYPQNDIKQANIITGSYKPGDYVIVQAGLVIEKVPKKQVRMWKQFVKTSA